MDDTSREPATGRTMPTRSEFDEEGYLLLYPDITAGVASGAIESGWSHFVSSGFAEGRSWMVLPDLLAGVSQEISPRDEMFTGNTEHYLDVGASALQCLETALLIARRPRSTVRRILDLPCGHGRVMRFLRKAFPEAELVACDLNRDGVDFCARAFGAVPEYSHVNVDEIPHQGVVDLIWCGSLFTHLSEQKCRDFLRFFQRILGHRGIVVFTTHGRYCARELAAGRNRYGIDDRQVAELLHDYRERGFAFVPYREQADYGISLTHPAFVTRQWIDDSVWRLLGYHETGWDRRQDVVSLQKSTGSIVIGI